jgi:hypothetical protein
MICRSLKPKTDSPDNEVLFNDTVYATLLNFEQYVLLLFDNGRIFSERDRRKDKNRHIKYNAPSMNSIASENQRS